MYCFDQSNARAASLICIASSSIDMVRYTLYKVCSCVFPFWRKHVSSMPVDVSVESIAHASSYTYKLDNNEYLLHVYVTYTY